MQREHIDKPFHELDRLEMARHIEHHAAIAEAGRIVNDHRIVGYRNTFAYGCGFAQRLDAVKNAGFRGAVDADKLLIHLQTIRFGVFIRRIEQEHNGIFIGLFGSNADFYAGRGFEKLGQELGIAFHLIVSGRKYDLCFFRQKERIAFGGTDFVGQRHNVVIGLTDFFRSPGASHHENTATYG